MPEQQPKIEVKAIKHIFTHEERESLGGDLARAIGYKRNVEAELDQVKQSFKSKIAEADSRIGTLESNLVNGFEFRQERCFVVMEPKTKKKHYFLESDPEGAPPVLTVPMEPQDFEQDLPLPPE